MLFNFSFFGFTDWKAGTYSPCIAIFMDQMGQNKQLICFLKNKPTSQKLIAAFLSRRYQSIFLHTNKNLQTDPDYVWFLAAQT